MVLLKNERGKNNLTPMEPIVAITKAQTPHSKDTILKAVRQALNLIKSDNLIQSGQTVLIKPNIFAPNPAPMTTDPRVVVALIKIAQEAGAREVLVGEGRSISTAKFRKANNTTRACSEVVGMTAAVEAAGGKMVFFDEEEWLETDVVGGLVLNKVRIPRPVLEADVLINVPVMKIHSLTLVTLGIKNMHGAISDEDKLFGHSYNELPSKLTDFLRVRKPDLTVLDGITALEGDHAEEGTPVDMGIIIASRDVVALDAVASSVMGFDPMEIDTTKIAHEQGLGIGDLSKITVVGESVESVRRHFARPNIAFDSELFPGLKIIAGEYCRSCQYYIRRGLDKLAKEGIFDGSREITLILGKEPPVPEKLPGKVIMLGDCCLSSKSIRRLRDHLLLEGRLEAEYACPPMRFRIRAKDMVS